MPAVYTTKLTSLITLFKRTATMAGEELTTELFGLCTAATFIRVRVTPTWPREHYSPPHQSTVTVTTASREGLLLPHLLVMVQAASLPTHTPHTPAPQPEVLAGY